VSVPPDWTPHRRDDGELLGWIRPDAGDAWVAIDVLGRAASGPVDWLEAEAVLEERGLAWLGGVWLLERDGAGPQRVRLAEVSTDGVALHVDDLGAIDRAVARMVLPWPAPERLRPPHPGEELPSPFAE
jgi:hypothetical protein